MPRAFKRRRAALAILFATAACAQSAGYGHAVNNAKLIAVTSPIPGAEAKLLPATATATDAAPSSHFCVTDAGYCPLAAAAPPRQNCLCETATLMYGGATGVPPQTYTPNGH
jgi:hypothetical protein